MAQGQNIKILGFFGTIVTSFIGIIFTYPFPRSGFEQDNLLYLSIGMIVFILLTIKWYLNKKKFIYTVLLILLQIFCCKFAGPYLVTGFLILSWLISVNLLWIIPILKKLYYSFENTCNNIIWFFGILNLSLTASVYSAITYEQVSIHYLNKAALKSTKIINFKESPIYWPGFQKPIGISVGFDVYYDLPKQGVMYGPSIYIDDLQNATVENFFTFSVTGPLWKNPNNSDAIDLSKSQSPIHLNIDLYPSHVRLANINKGICIEPYNYNFNLSNEMVAVFFAAIWPGKYGAVDLSKKLTELISTKTQLFNNPHFFTDAVKELSNPLAVGYHQCNLPNIYKAPCYCIRDKS